MVNQGVVAVIDQVEEDIAIRRIARVVGESGEEELRGVVVFELIGLGEGSFGNFPVAFVGVLGGVGRRDLETRGLGDWESG
jgi:hypothetical protein